MTALTRIEARERAENPIDTLIEGIHAAVVAAGGGALPAKPLLEALAGYAAETIATAPTPALRTLALMDFTAELARLVNARAGQPSALSGVLIRRAG